MNVKDEETMDAKEIEAQLRERGYPTDAGKLAKFIHAYILKERDRCARVAEGHAKLGQPGLLRDARLHIAELIRMGGEPGTP